MSKIRNINGSDKSKLGGYVGPIEIGRGGKRKSPDDFSGAAPPGGFSLARLGFLKRRIIAAFFAATHALTLAPGREINFQKQASMIEIRDGKGDNKDMGAFFRS